MASAVPKVLILGHSFVRRLSSDLSRGFDPRAFKDFKLQGTASVSLHGVGGRTVASLRSFDLHVISRLAPDIVILEIGTNDLSRLAPEVVGSAIEDLVQFLLDRFSVRVVGVCLVIPRGASHVNSSWFFEHTLVLHKYLEVVLELFPQVFCWRHRDFTHPAKDFYLPDGVHLNPSGQFLLYRSYRGAILRAISML